MGVSPRFFYRPPKRLRRMPVRYLLLADGDMYVCRGWDALVDRLVWARGQDHGAVLRGWKSDRPLIPSECDSAG